MKRRVIFVVLVLFRLGVRSQILITVGGDFPRSWCLVLKKVDTKVNKI